eukprot:Hpha_TRINITY_DN33047_c0_g1::TRINITY_DN33047_c0_g1_i1::g.158669::m.158669
MPVKLGGAAARCGFKALWRVPPNRPPFDLPPPVPVPDTAPPRSPATPGKGGTGTPRNRPPPLGHIDPLVPPVAHPPHPQGAGKSQPGGKEQDTPPPRPEEGVEDAGWNKWAEEMERELGGMPQD